MAKIKLGTQPKTVSKDLSFPMLDGTIGEIKVDYVYRNRKAFAQFVDDHITGIRSDADAAAAAANAKIKTAQEAGDEEQLAELSKLRISESEIAQKQIDSQVKFIMSAVSGWNLDIPFDREAVEELASTVPQAAAGIIDSYRIAMTEGRLGN